MIDEETKAENLIDGKITKFRVGKEEEREKDLKRKCTKKTEDVRKTELE